MIAGTLGAGLANHLPGKEAAYIIIISYCAQGMGWWLAVLKCVPSRACRFGSERLTERVGAG